MSVRNKAAAARAAASAIQDQQLQLAMLAIVDLLLEIGKRVQDIEDDVHKIKNR